MTALTTVRSLQHQYEFEIGIHIEKLEPPFGGNKKKFYRAKWKKNDPTPLVLMEIEGDDMIQEIMLNISLDHPYIIKTFGLVRPTADIASRGCLLVLQEFSEDGNLGELLNSKRFIPEVPVMIEICAQIANAMTYLAKQNIIHGDLQSRNVLVFKTNPTDPRKNLVKVIDFGLSRSDSKASAENCIYPIRFAATEIVRSKGRSGYSEKSDVFSFAVVVWEIFSEAVFPFSEITDDKLIEHEKLKGTLLKRPQKCPDKLWSLMLDCWNMEPKRRPDFQTIHERLTNMDNSRSSSSHQFAKLSSRRFEPSLPIVQSFRDAPLPASSLQTLAYEGRATKRYRSSHNDWSADIDDSNNESIRDESWSFDDESIIDKSALPNIRRSNFGRDLSNRNISQAKRSIISSELNLRQPSYAKRKTSAIPESNYRSQVITTDKRSTSASVISRSQPNAIVDPPLPCEMCKKNCKASELAQHQLACLEQQRVKIESKRKEIAYKKICESATCRYCNKQIALQNLNDHETKCSHNPVNVPDDQDNDYDIFRNFEPSIKKTNAETRMTQKGARKDVPQANQKKVSWFQKFLNFFKKGKS